MRHNFDWVTDFCKKCGKSFKQTIDKEVDDCIEENNIYGITHKIARKQLFSQIRTAAKSDNPTPN